MKPRIIFATAIMSHPPIGGPELRIENSIKALAQIADVHLYSRKPENRIGGAPATEFLKRYCRSVQFLRIAPFWYRIARRLTKSPARGNLGSQSLQWMDHPAAMDDIVRLARALKPDLIWLGYGHTSTPLLRLLKRKLDIPVVADTDSVWSRFLGRELPYVDDPKRHEELRREVAAKELEERAIVELADITTAVSPVDEDYYRQYASGRPCVKRFSNVLDVDCYAQRPAPAPDMAHPSVYIAGSFYAPGCPMEHATRWFVSSVLPLILKTFPGVRVFILGKGAETLVQDLAGPNVVCKGFVPSVLPYLCHADVVAVPLWFESGTRFKILEAGACRRGVVSTTLGAEGLPTQDKQHLLIADTPEAFAEATCRLLADPALSAELGERLLHLVNATSGLPALVDEARVIIRALKGGA